MPAEIKTKITAENDTNAAFDQAKSNVKGFSASVSSIDDAFGKGIQGIRNFTDGFVNIQAGMQMAGDAIRTVEAGIDATLGKAMEYNAKINDISRTLGINAEETSKTVGAMRLVGISYDQAEGAINKAIQNGFLPSIENLKTLADKYNNLQSPIAKAQLATATFGRSAGPDMAELLGQGSAGIDKLVEKATNLGVVLDQSAADKAENLGREIEKLKLQEEMLNVAVGEKAIPILLTYSTALNNLDESQKTLEKTTGIHAGTISTLNILYSIGLTRLKEYKEEADKAKASIDDLSASESKFNSGGQYNAHAITSGQQGYNYFTHTAPTRASGGPVWAGIPSGFNSEETFVPKTNGWILPPGSGSSSVTNQGGDTYQFNITGANAQEIASSVKEEIRRMKRSKEI